MADWFTKNAPPPVEAPPAAVERGGITAPFTSLLAPELEGVRSGVNTRLATPHGTPIMARSRTGALYPSETGTGAVNAAKSGVGGAISALLDQAEGVTSPAGLATAGVVKGVHTVAQSPWAQGSIARLMQMVGDFDLVHPFKSTVGKVGAALESSANAAREAELTANRYLPNKSGYPSSATPATPVQTSRVPYARPTEAFSPVDVDPYLPNKSGYPNTEGLGQQTSRVPYARPTETAPMPGALSPTDKALLLKQGYSPELIQRLEQSSMASMAKPAAAAPRPTAPAPTETPSTLLQQLQDSLAARQSAQTANIGHNAPFGEGAILPSTMLPTELRAAEMAGLEHPGQGTWDLASGTLKPKTPIDSRISSLAPGSQPLPVYPSAGTVKGVSSNALETASNAALAAGHWDEAERLIGQSLQSFFQGSGGPMAGILAAAVAHKARQVVEPLRADPMFQRAAPAKQQQMIQQALRQPGGRASLTSLLGSAP